MSQASATPRTIAQLAAMGIGDASNAVTASGAANLLYYQNSLENIGQQFEREAGRHLQTSVEVPRHPTGMRYCGDGTEECTDFQAQQDPFYNPPNEWSAQTGQFRAPKISEIPIVNVGNNNNGRQPQPQPQPQQAQRGGGGGGGGGGGDGTGTGTTRFRDSDNRSVYVPSAQTYGGETAIVRESNGSNLCPPTDACAAGMLIGANIVSQDGGVYSHRKLNMTREPGTRVDEVYVQRAAVGDYATSNAAGNVQHHTQPYGNYAPALYDSPTLDSERRISTGVMMNAWTGQMYETFESDLPPPNTDKSLTPGQFERTNPKLVAMKGGRDPNRDYQSKRELCQRIPGDDGGGNVFGDALYADRRRENMQQRANRTVFMNRGGDVSVQAAWDRKPVGFVGYQRAYNFMPYLRPTQTLDLEGWVGPVTPQGIMPNIAMSNAQKSGGDDPYRIVAAVTYKGTDLSDCPHNGNVDTSFGDNVGFQGAILPTQKTLMSQQFPTLNAGGQADTGQALQFQGALTGTQKTLMSQQFPTLNAGGQSDTGQALQFQGKLIGTQKTLMQQSFATLDASGKDDTGGGLRFQGDVRETTKYMLGEAQYPTLNAALPNAGMTGVFEHGAVSIHNFRGNNDAEYFHIPFSQVPLGSEGAAWAPTAKSQRDTKRRTEQSSARPGVYSDNNPRWISELSTPCVSKGERQSTYARSHQTRFGSIVGSDQLCCCAKYKY